MAIWMKWFTQSVVVLAMSAVSMTSPPITSVNAASDTSEAVKTEEDIKADASSHGFVAPFTGSYIFVGGQEQKDQVTQAIENMVQQLNVLIRGIARDRLGPPNVIPTRVHVNVNEGFTTITLDDRKIRAELNGTNPTNWTDMYGKPVRVWHKVRQGLLTEQMVGKGGTRKNVFTLSPDGKKLTIDVTMDSKHFPTPIKYRLTYQRNST